MMNTWIFVMMTSMLWTVCRCQNGCTSNLVNASQIVFTCSSNVTTNELPLYNYNTSQLASITSIEVNGINNSTPGPFTSIPPNLCLLRNLQYIDFSFNQITQVDPSAALSGCLTSVTILDLSYNNISQFPSFMIYNMPSLQYLYFQHNQLIEVPSNSFSNVLNLQDIDFSYNSLTTFDLWALFVNSIADFSHNQISTITNKYFFSVPSVTSSNLRSVLLANNGPTINFTDAIYEMYNSCYEVIDWLELPGNDGNFPFPTITSNLLALNFGATQISCSCDQAYILDMLQQAVGQLSGLTGYSIYNATCTDGTKFLLSTCAPKNGGGLSNSTVNFTQVYPRQCRIRQNAGGNLTAQNASAPTSNVSTYPYYTSQLMNPGACFFTFTSSTAARIKCTTDVSSASTIPSTLLSSSYFASVTTIDFTMPISSLPQYLCSLPSRQIDLSYQAFTILDDAVFPCLDWFTRVSLSHNNITTVNMASGNFQNLNYLDLSSNRLTVIPYSILHPTPTSLRFLDLRNNSITSIDLFVYTLKNITIDLRYNPINNSTITNTQNVTLPSGNTTNSTVIIDFPSSVTNSTYIFNDQTALAAGTCDSASVLQLLSILQMTYSTVVLDCSCASINVRDMFIRAGANILNSFNCLNPSDATTFPTLSTSSCSSAVNFTQGLCYNASLQRFMDETKVGALIININILITNNSLTSLMNASMLSNITENQQYTSLPEFEQTGLDLYTLPTSNNSNKLTPVSSVSTTLANNGSSNQIHSTAMMFDNEMTISLGWTTTTTTTTTTTSSSSSSSSSTSSSSSSSTSSTSSTSTSTTSQTTTTSTTSTTTTTITATSTSTSTSTTSKTTSTSSSSTSSTSSSSTSSTSSTSTSSTTSTATSSTSSTSTTSTSSTSTSSTSSTSKTSTSSTSSSSSTSISSTSTSSTSSTSTTASTAAGVALGSSGDSSSNRTGLIVGLVVGLVGFFALVGALVAVIVWKKSKGAAGVGKPIGRATAISQAPEHALLEPRLKTRNARAVRLAPLSAKPSQLPPLTHSPATPVTVVTDPSAHNRSNLLSSVRGIPIHHDPIRSPSNVVPDYAPSSYTANDSFHFQSISNPPTTHQPSSPQMIQRPQAPRPQSHQILNIGGDTRY